MVLTHPALAIAIERHATVRVKRERERPRTE
jgi:hypothetical protein